MVFKKLDHSAKDFFPVGRQSQDSGVDGKFASISPVDCRSCALCGDSGMTIKFSFAVGHHHPFFGAASCEPAGEGITEERAIGAGLFVLFLDPDRLITGY
jgi:hypothetical protein